jgi:hypothetical protein
MRMDVDEQSYAHPTRGRGMPRPYSARR